MAVDINLTPTADMPPVTTDTTGTTATTGTSTTQGSSGITPSPEAQAAAGAEVAAQQGIATAQQAVEAAQAPAAEAKAKGADEEAALLVKDSAAADLVRRAYLDRINAASQAADSDAKKFENYQFHDYWSSLPMGKRIGAKIQMAIGGFASAFLGGPNVALEQLNRLADRDFEQQKLQLASREKIAAARRAGVTDLYGAMQRDLAALEMKQALAHKAIAAKAQAEAIRQGIPLEQATQHVLVAGSLATAAEKELAAKQRYESHFQQEQARKAETARKAEEQITSAKKGQGGGVEADKNAANFDVLKNHGTWIAQEMPKLSAEDIKAVNAVMGTEDFLQGDGTVKALIAAGAAKAGFDPETGISSTAKEYLDRVRRAAEGLGRVQSGAAIGSVENKRFVKSLMPQTSDSPEDLTKRADRIMQDINSRGAYLARPPRAGGGADPKAAVKQQIRDASAWIAEHPNDPKVAQVRTGIARLNLQLGAP